MSDVSDVNDMSATSSDAEAASKDAFFQQLAGIASAMTAAHGKDFSMGALVLAARFIAEGEARERAAAQASAQAAATAAAGPSIVLS
jgi:hypothetical protein